MFEFRFKEYMAIAIIIAVFYAGTALVHVAESYGCKCQQKSAMTTTRPTT